MFRRYRNFSRGNSAFRGQLAKKQLLWVFTANEAVALSSTVATNLQLVQPSQWVRNTTAGGRERCKVLRVEWLTSIVPDGTNSSTYAYALSVYANDTTDLTSPLGAAYWSNVPGFTWGTMYVPDAAGADVTLGYRGNRDDLRVRKCKRLMDSTQSLWLTLGSGINGQLISVYSRALIEYR